jgi:diaminohydroxyphosphoribosylaminopyrimidine deaminase/5-amino-6-(5-phosphoribosylamino)uracil reductase
VLDTRLRTPPTSQLVRTARSIPTLICCGRSAQRARVARYVAAGCELISLPLKGAHVSLTALLDELGRRQMTNVVVEGGSAVLGAFHDAGEADELVVYIAPRVIGGGDALGAIGGVGIARIADARALTQFSVTRLGDGVVVRARL